ncbi:Ionotropic receptor 329 [Blattella germanica]|nr:Ionotropic receptor 329 [Blattella germanica]
MSLKCVFVACYLLVSCWSQLSLPNEEDFEAYSVAECVYNLSSVYFDRDLPIFVQTPRKITDRRYFKYMEKIIQKLQIQNQFSVILLGGTKFRPIENAETVSPGSYIIVLPTSLAIDDLYYMRDSFVQMALYAYNPKGKVVIVNPEEKGVVVHGKPFPLVALSLAWQANFLQAIFLDPEPVAELDFNVYSWTINDQIDLCSGEIDNIKHIDTWLTQEGRFSRDSKLFQVNENLDFKGCELNLYWATLPPYSWVTRGTYEGIVAEFLHHFSDLINVHFRPTQDLENVHIAFPNYYTDDGHKAVWPNTYPHIFEKLTWLVPSGKQIPRWQSLWRTFSPLLWFLILLTFTCGTFTIWLLHKSTGESIFSVFVSSVLTHLGIGVSDRYKGFVATLFFTIWLFYCLIINTSYQSELFRLLVNPGNFPAIETLKELEESHLIKKRVIEASGNGSYLNEFIMQYNKCEGTIFEFCKKVAIDRTNAILYSGLYINLVLSIMDDLLDEFKNPKLVPLKETVGTFYVSLQVRRMSSLLHDLLDNALQIFISAGFFDFWSSSFQNMFRSRFIDHDIIDRFVFSLNHLQGAFILFFLGHLLASVIYIIEISTHFILNYFFLHTITGCLSRIYLF